jgi:hypothetical protein
MPRKKPARLGVPTLDAYRLTPEAVEIAPGRAPRRWMDLTDQRYAYRCLPLSIANASGWELLSPVSFTASWDGGDDKRAVSVSADDPAEQGALNRFAVSHFGGGVLTFHSGYLFRTSPGWALSVRGCPNTDKPRIAPLEGLVETDWLDFPFTVNWRFTRSGTTFFLKGEAFAFIQPVAHALLDDVQPVVSDIAAAPIELRRAYAEKSQSRTEFNAALAARDPETVKQGWQKDYVRGCPAAQHHVTKRRLKAPKAAA